MKEQIKRIVFAILDKQPGIITSAEMDFLQNNVTYEMLEEYQKLTGKGIFIEGINAEPEEEVINVSALDLINLMQHLENTK